MTKMGWRPRDVYPLFTVILRPPKDLAVLPPEKGSANIG